MFGLYLMGLPRYLRLTHADDFARVRREGRVLRHKLLLVSIAPNTVGHNRYGIVTAKKIGKAYQRNRVRRVLRETLRLQHPYLQAGFDVVLVAHAGAVDAAWPVIQATVEALFQQAGLMAVE